MSHRHFYLDRYTMLHLGMHLNPNICTVLFTPIHSPDPGGALMLRYVVQETIEKYVAFYSPNDAFCYKNSVQYSTVQ